MKVGNFYCFRPLHIAIVHENARLIQKLVGLISLSKLTVNTPNNLSQVRFIFFYRIIFFIKYYRFPNVNPGLNKQQPKSIAICTCHESHDRKQDVVSGMLKRTAAQ
jgi:hypothetical protein